jgi:phenylacetate-CoA ligase
MRLGPVIGRKQQMIKFKGTTLYPPAIYDVLNEIDCIDNYIVEVYTNDLGTDELLVKAACKPGTFGNEKIIKDHFRAKLRVAPDVEFLNPKEISKLQMPPKTRKPIIFIDNRNN